MRYSYAYECLPDAPDAALPVPTDRKTVYTMLEEHGMMALGIGLGLIGVGAAAYLVLRK